MAALSTIAAVGAGLLASKLLKPKNQPAPTFVAPPPPPDTAKLQRDAAEAAQDAAALQRRRAQSSGTNGGTLLTGPVGLTQPVPVAKKTLLGQ